MKLDQLRYFLETAREEHIGRAARTVSVSPSAVHHAITGLEIDLGVKLFRKQGRTIQVTEAGRRLQAHAERILSELELVREDVSTQAAVLRGHLRLVASHVLSRKLVAPVAAKLIGEHKNLRCEVITLRSAEVLHSVLNGEADLGVCFAPQPDPRLNAILLYESSLVIYVRKNHPVLKLPPRSQIKALAKYPSAMPKAFAGIEVCSANPLLKENGIEPKGELLFDSYEVATEFLLHGDSWSLLPEWVVQENGKARDRLVALSPKRSPSWQAPTGICVVHRKDRLLSSSERALIETLREFRKN